MQQAVLIRLRPLGPWRYGPDDGGRDRLDTLFRSDRLFSAVTLAMRRLGWLEEWLDATARAAHPGVTFSSLFPFQGETLFALPPSTLWPPPLNLVTAPSPVFLAKIRWSMARFVPLPVIDSLMTGQNILADQWLPDPESGCLLRRDRPSSSPFRTVTRTCASVDRLAGVSHHTDSLACIEFEPGSGLWTIACFSNSEAESIWSDRLQAAFRLLADSGFGGRRSSGWGQARMPEFQRGLWPGMLFPKTGRARGGSSTLSGNGTGLYWLLSLYSPAWSDQVDWGNGDYRLTIRGGRVESASGTGVEKKSLRMIAEGSVIAAKSQPAGVAVDVAPEGFAHAVFRSGLALALLLPTIAPEPEFAAPVEPPATEEAIEQKPCEEPPGAVEAEGPIPAEASLEHAEAAEKVAAEETAPLEQTPGPVFPPAEPEDRLQASEQSPADDSGPNNKQAPETEGSEHEL